MKNTEELRKLLHSMNDFSAAYGILKDQIALYEQETGESVNDLPGFTESYPFDKSFDELNVGGWVATTVDRIRQDAFKVLNYTYLNTGGNTMVGIFEVWLPAEMRVVFALTNEEGCTLSVVDYISNDLDVDDYDELYIDTIDWGRATGHEKYFELYRHCLNEYTKSDCRYFGYTRGLPYHLLSDELQKQITDEYRKWFDAQEFDIFETDGEKIIIRPDYEQDSVWNKMLEVVKAFKEWHDTTAGVEDLYDQNYTLTFAGHTVELPYNADVWDAVDTMLERTIRDW